MSACFISDLHLHPSRPAISRCCIDFLATLKADEQLYILGDLFEAWVGDDHPEPTYEPVKEALLACTTAGTQVFVLHGNRDFLLGERFAAETGCRLIEDPTVIELCGRRTLLMHGDSLCTDDRDYQALRARLRHPQWQQQALSLPLDARLRFARQAREMSTLATAERGEQLLDVNPGEVLRVLERHNAELLIHGHTHRPGIHRLRHGGRDLQRVVLGDWYEQGSVLRVAPGQLELTSLPA